MKKKTRVVLYSATMIIILVILLKNVNSISIFFENKFQFREDRVFGDGTTYRIHYVSDGDISFSFQDPDFTDISSYIKANIDHNFDINNYTIHLTNPREAYGVIDFVYTINGIETNISHVVIINDA